MAQLAEGRYPVTEAEETTRDWIAYSVGCPECREPAGFRCVYTTGPDSEISAYGRPRVRQFSGKLRLKGEMTIRPHYQRMNVALDEERRRVVRARRRKPPPPEPAEPVTDKEAYAVACPLCKRRPGQRCKRVQEEKKRETFRGGYTGQWVTVHRKGTNIARPHPQRRRAAEQLRLARWKRDNPADWRAAETARARAALAAFDLAEYEQLRSWLAEHGHILWDLHLVLSPDGKVLEDVCRPDGTRRGDTYALG